MGKNTCHNSVACSPTSDPLARYVSQFSPHNSTIKKKNTNPCLEWIKRSWEEFHCKLMKPWFADEKGKSIWEKWREIWQLSCLPNVRKKKLKFITWIFRRAASALTMWGVLCASLQLPRPAVITRLFSRREVIGIWAKLPRFKSTFHHLVTEWPHTNDLTSVSYL